MAPTFTTWMRCSLNSERLISLFHASGLMLAVTLDIQGEDVAKISDPRRPLPYRLVR
jgi:hypothetical protein